MKSLIAEKKLRHLHIRAYKDPTGDEYEIVFTSSQWPYWRKTLKTEDDLTAQETFDRWKNHGYVLQFLPARLCHYLVIGS